MSSGWLVGWLVGSFRLMVGELGCEYGSTLWGKDGRINKVKENY